MIQEQRYNHLIEKVQMQDLFLKDIHISRFPIGDEGNLSANIHFVPELKHFDEKNLITAVEFSVSAINDYSETLFSMEFEYVAIYSVDEWDTERLEPTVEEAVLFAERNVPMNVWPFVREFISDMTGRIGVPRLMIGMYLQVPEEKVVDEDDTD